jgi:hypothetical protein
MRLGVPFIAPRQLGAVEDQPGRQFLPSVEWCTGQSGAPLDSPCSCPVRDRLPHQVYPTVGAVHVLPADCAADRWRGRPLAHRIVRCTTGQSGEL